MPLPPCRLSLSDFHATNSKESTYKLVIIIIIAAMVVGTIFASGFLITLKFSQEIVVLVQKRDITQRGPSQLTNHKSSSYIITYCSNFPQISV